MRKVVTIIIVIILLIIIGGYLYFNVLTEKILSSEQEEIIDELGHPQRFTLAFLPEGDGDEAVLARNEVWSYPEHGQEYTFVSGQVQSVDEIAAETKSITYSSLKPEEFDYGMNYDQVAAVVGSDSVEAVNIVGELYKEGEVETFMADYVIFAIEYDHLTFFQTVGIDESEGE